MTARRPLFGAGAIAPARQSLSLIREPACGACGLYKSCNTPKMEVKGRGHKRILVVGEAPGETEDERGKPFIGESGLLLQKMLRRAGIELFHDCWVTNALRCRPRNNRMPKNARKAIEHCRPLLLKALKDLKPERVLVLGAHAVASVIGWLWREDTGGIMSWAGWRIPSTRLNAWVCPTFHPSFVLRGKRNSRDGIDVAEALMQSHIDAFAALEGRPYDPSPPEYTRLVKRLINPREASDEIHRMIDAGEPVAFDYETDRLKPDHPDARIVCCAVSNGRTSVAFPWHGRAIHAMEELLTEAPLPKIGWNKKFEGRWTRKEFGRGVNKWAFDGMLNAHGLDSRRGTKSLKFQAFARLGVDSYDDAVKPSLKADGGNEPNGVDRMDLDALLKYCGTDALLEFRLAEVLSKELGVALS